MLKARAGTPVYVKDHTRALPTIPMGLIGFITYLSHIYHKKHSENTQKFLVNSDKLLRFAQKEIFLIYCDKFTKRIKKIIVFYALFTIS